MTSEEYNREIQAQELRAQRRHRQFANGEARTLFTVLGVAVAGAIFVLSLAIFAMEALK